MIHWGAWLGLVRVLCFVITSASLLGAGCRRSDPIDAVGITGVDSPVISAASPLELRAEGLPSARRVQVRLHGRLAAAGQDERALDVSLVGHVLSPERLSVAVDAPLIARWGRATFDGELVVDCDPPTPRGCHGRLAQARFDVALLGERRAQPLHSAVARLLPSLGLEISDADSATFGLLVSEVRVGGLAARAGLRPGDTIVRSNGVSLHALADLAPGPSADVLSLVLRRAGGQLVTLRVPLADAPPLADLRLLGLCLAASPILLLLFSRLGMPAPSALVWGMRSSAIALRSSAGWPFAVGAGLSAIMGVYASLAATLFDPFVMLLVHLGGAVLLWGLREKGVQRLAADVLGVWAGALCVVAVSGTRAWPLILRDQGALPWAWNALARLPLSAACLLFVLSAARMHRALNVRTQGRLSAQVWEQGLSALLAALCASLFFGGVFVSQSASAWVLTLAAALAAFKSVACYGLLRVLAGIKLLRSRKWLWIAMFAVTPLWVRLVPGRPFEVIWGSVACVLCACIALAGLMSSRGAQPEAAPPRAKSKAPAQRARASGAQLPPKAATQTSSARATRPLPQTQS